MPAFGVSLEEFAGKLEPFFNQQGRDWSMDIAIHLAMSYLAFKKLEELGINFEVGQRKTILPSLERAWRELLYQRISNIPAEVTMDDVDRPLYLTRTGRIANAKPITLRNFKRYYSNSFDQDKHRERDADARPTPGLRTRRTRQPVRPKTARTHTDGG